MSPRNNRIARSIGIAGLSLLMLCSFVSPAPAKGKLGKYFKAEALDFKIRVPDDWNRVEFRSKPPNLVGMWQGPRMQVNVKKLGTYGFSNAFRLMWFNTQPMEAVTQVDETEAKDPEIKNLDPEELKKLLEKRKSLVTARSLEQWLTNFSGLSGVRIVEKKEAKLGKRPAVEYEVLSKTDLNVDFKHYALSVKVSEHYDVAMMYTVIEPKYKEWKSFFRRCAKTLDLDWPDLPKPSSRSITSSRKTSGGKTDAADEDAVAFVDRLITQHGRIVEGQVAEEGEHYVIQWKLDSIRIPKSLVKQVEFGDPARYSTLSDADRKNMDKGFVKYNGRWISRNRYKTELRRAKEKVEAKLARLRAHADPADPWRKETSRFIVETTTSEELLNHYVDLIEALFSVYEKTLGVSVSSEARKRKPLIRVFKDEQEYQNFSKAPGTGGYFHWVDNSLNLYHNFEDPDLSEKTLLHEGTHLLNFLSNTNFIRKPMWVEEGAAEYFGSSTRNRDAKDRIKLLPGQILGNRLLRVFDRIDSGKVRNLRDALDTTSYQYEDYAYWWSTFHFFMTHDKYKGKFLNYYRSLYALRGVEKRNVGSSFFAVTPGDSVKYLEKSLGIRDWGSLQAEWEQFIRDSVSLVSGHGWMVLGRDLYQEALRIKYVPNKEIDDEERSKLYSENLDEALVMLDKAIVEKEYLKADAFYWRALVQKSRNKADDALKDLDQAVALDPLNAQYYAKRASLRYKTGAKKEARGDLRIAMALDPLDILFPLMLKEMEQGTFIDLSRS